MIDVQSQRLKNGKKINKVGVKNLRYPILVKDKFLTSQPTVASINMYVELPDYSRATHMSRFLEIINEVARDRIGPKKIRSILLRMNEVLSAESSHIEISFPYFIEKTAPSSKSKSLMEYQCMLIGSIDEAKNFKLILEVNAMVLNLCPCSKELSIGASAHNQRSKVTVRIISDALIWIEDLVEIIESSASSSIYTILKRSDEKFVMELAHENPRFVEDIVREIAGKLDLLTEIRYYSVSSENFESIHNHNVYAYIEKKI